jgi:hypothetical protein
MSTSLPYCKLTPTGDWTFLVLLILLFYKICHYNLIIETLNGIFTSFIKKVAIFSPSEKHRNKFLVILHQVLIP